MNKDIDADTSNKPLSHKLVQIMCVKSRVVARGGGEKLPWAPSWGLIPHNNSLSFSYTAFLQHENSKKGHNRNLGAQNLNLAPGAEYSSYGSGKTAVRQAVFDYKTTVKPE